MFRCPVQVVPEQAVVVAVGGRERNRTACNKPRYDACNKFLHVNDALQGAKILC